jgi:hypothetical protein
VVLETMDRYPGKTAVLTDIDCYVHGEIRPVTGTPRTLPAGLAHKWNGAPCSVRFAAKVSASGL